MITHYDMITGEEIVSEHPKVADRMPHIEGTVACSLADALDPHTHTRVVEPPACIVAMLPIDVLIDSAGGPTNRPRS